LPCTRWEMACHAHPQSLHPNFIQSHKETPD
jgi:hypothetical protein